MHDIEKSILQNVEQWNRFKLETRKYIRKYLSHAQADKISRKRHCKYVTYAFPT